MKNYLADRTKLIDASGIRKVFALAAKMKDPVNFSIGQPDFDVPDAIKSAAINAIQNGFNSYSQTAGDEDLKAKIAEITKAEVGWDNAQALVNNGVSGALQLMFMALINPGDEVIMPDPYFVIYKHLINLMGGKCVYVNSYPDFNLPIEGIKSAITDKTKLILVNSPSNPTGVVYTDAELKELAKIARQKDIIVMSDEIYDKFCYDCVCPSIAKYYEKTIILKGFGKTYGMTGWRMGYTVVHQELSDVLEQMIKIQQYTFVCAPRPFQRAVIAAFDTDMSDYVAKYKTKRDLIYNGLKDKFECVKPGGAFYIFAKAPNGSAAKFVEKAIENNVLIIPGNVFSEKDTHFRISYATKDEKIRQGIDILNKIA